MFLWYLGTKRPKQYHHLNDQFIKICYGAMPTKVSCPCVLTATDKTSLWVIVGSIFLRTVQCSNCHIRDKARNLSQGSKPWCREWGGQGHAPTLPLPLQHYYGFQSSESLRAHAAGSVPARIPDQKKRERKNKLTVIIWTSPSNQTHISQNATYEGTITTCENYHCKPGNIKTNTCKHSRHHPWGTRKQRSTTQPLGTKSERTHESTCFLRKL